MKKLAVLALGVLVAACSETPTETPTMDAPPVAFSETGPPQQSGPIVFRFEGFATFLVGDPKTGYAAYFGANIVNLCQGIPDFSVSSILNVLPPEDPNRIIQVVQGNDVDAHLFDYTPQSCADVLARGPIASGIGRFTQTDNDLLVFLNPDNQNANAFGVAGHATMYDGGGQEITVNARSRCVWDGVDPASLTCRDGVTVDYE